MRYPIAHPPHQRGSDTSAEGAESVARKFQFLWERILTILDNRGPRGATDHELQEKIGCQLCSINAARRRLVVVGDVIDSGFHRKSKYNVKNTIWILKKHAPPEWWQRRFSFIEGG